MLIWLLFEPAFAQIWHKITSGYTHITFIFCRILKSQVRTDQQFGETTLITSCMCCDFSSNGWLTVCSTTSKFYWLILQVILLFNSLGFMMNLPLHQTHNYFNIFWKSLWSMVLVEVPPLCQTRLRLLTSDQIKFDFNNISRMWAFPSEINSWKQGESWKMLCSLYENKKSE